MTIARNVLELIGQTPLVRLNRVVPNGSAEVFAKLEAFNPGGSVKDRIGARMVEDAERGGLLRPGGTIVEPTSGNTGVGLALAAIVKGYRLVCVMPDKVPMEKRRLLTLFGAEVVTCPTAVDPNDPRSYYSVARRLARERHAFMPNQYSNPANPAAHYATTGPEIWADTNGGVDALVCGVGTGGTITGVGRFLKEKKPSMRVVGVDPEGSVLKEAFDTGAFKTKPKTYFTDGIGEDFLPTTLHFRYIDEFLTVGDAEAYAMARTLARSEGILAGSSSGAAVAGAVRVAAGLGPGKKVVVIVPDSGERYLSKLNDDWMAERGLMPGIARA